MGRGTISRAGPGYEAFGNFNFGATGGALGIDLETLLRSAGWAQRRAGTSRREWNIYYGKPPYGDDPQDQAQIRAGFEFYSRAESARLRGRSNESNVNGNGRDSRPVAAPATQRRWLFAVVLALTGGFGCAPLCENTILTSVPSPSKRRTAVVFVRNCGATTDFSTQVSVLRAGQRLGDTGGNCLVVDSDHGAVQTGRSGELVVSVSWRSDDRLLVRYPRRSRVFERSTTVNGVTVSFEPVMTQDPGRR